MTVRELYEEFPFPLQRSQSGFLHRYVFPYAPVRPVHVLDAGCGTGNMTVELAARFPSARVVGVDFSQHSLAEARLLAQRRKAANVEFRHHDLMEAFPSRETPEHYDFAISIGCLHHIPDPVIALRHIAGVLSPDAVLILGVYGKWGRIETEMRRQLIDALRHATGGSTAQMLLICSSLLAEPALRENGFYKANIFLMPLRNPRRFASLLKERVLGTLGMARVSNRIPVDISRADQYLHPLVLDWPAGQWLDTIQSAGLAVERFIDEPGRAGMCIPRNALTRLKDPDLRALIEGLPPRQRYEVLDLMFRPSMHLFACKPVC